MAVCADNDTLFHFDSHRVRGDARWNRPNRKLFLSWVHVVIIETARITLATEHAPHGCLMVPQPLLLLGNLYNGLLSVAVFTDVEVILPLVRTICVTFPARYARVRKYGWRDDKRLMPVPFLPPWKVTSRKVLLHAYVILSTLTRAVTSSAAPRSERLSRWSQLQLISPTENICTRPPRFTCCC